MRSFLTSYTRINFKWIKYLNQESNLLLYDHKNDFYILKALLNIYIYIPQNLNYLQYGPL